jgi:hypothetical protein
LTDQVLLDSNVPCQNRHDSLFADFTNDGEFHTTFLHVHYAVGGIALRVDDLCPFKPFSPRQLEKSLCVESAHLGGHTLGFFVLRNCDHFPKTNPQKVIYQNNANREKAETRKDLDQTNE